MSRSRDLMVLRRVLGVLGLGPTPGPTRWKSRHRAYAELLAEAQLVASPRTASASNMVSNDRTIESTPIGIVRSCSGELAAHRPSRRMIGPSS